MYRQQWAKGRSKYGNNSQEYTAGQITARAITLLELRGMVVWRANNIAVRGRAFIGKEGLGDISGYHKNTGRRVECEVKKIGDKMKEAQHQFLYDVHKAGGYAFVAHQEGNEIVLDWYMDYRKKLKLPV